MKSSPAWLLATLCGLGRVPAAPGTAGSAVGLALYWAAWGAGGWVPFILFALVLAGGVWAAGVVEREEGRRDPQEVVVDEVAGQLLCLLGWAPSLPVLVAGFVAFRVFDIWKPWRRLEALPGGWGIVADDLAAGAAGWVVLAIGRGAGFL